jgi:adenylate cyclase
MRPSHVSGGNSLADARRRKTLLLVDDDADVLLSLSRLVERMIPNVDFITASSADEGLRIIESHPIDVVVSDFRMPEKDGIQFLEEAKRRVPGLVTLMLTAYPSQQIAQDAVKRGGVILLITKPFDPEYFVKVLEAITTAG